MKDNLDGEEIPEATIFNYFQHQCFDALEAEAYDGFKTKLDWEVKLEIEKKDAFQHMDDYLTTAQKIEAGRRKYLYYHITIFYIINSKF